MRQSEAKEIVEHKFAEYLDEKGLSEFLEPMTSISFESWFSERYPRYTNFRAVVGSREMIVDWADELVRSHNMNYL